MIGKNINLKFGLNTIYDDANFIIPNNSKVGIIGTNGCGKTTLFRVMLKEIELDSGTIQYSSNIGYLPQVIDLKDQNMKVFDYLLNARPIKQLNEQISDLYNRIIACEKDNEKDRILKKIGKLEEKLVYYDQYNAENTLMEIIDNMKIDDNILDLQLKNLSGGQKSKIAFAHLLYSKAELLLLDEPTNHLDATTREYIISYLKAYEGMALIISHDIKFLNAIVDKIMHIDAATHKISVYNGNYSDYQQKSTAANRNKELLIANQEKEIKKLRDFVLLYSNSSGKRKRIAQSREKLLLKKEKELVSRDKRLKTIHLHLQPLNEGSKIPIQVNNLTFGYTVNNLFDNLSFLLNNKERLLILGENGVGKSTLLKLIMKELTPKDGSISFGTKTEIAYYAQEQEDLDLDKTVFENVSNSKYTDKQIFAALGDFLFKENDFYKKVSVLSPGERARINLAKIMLKQANLLILDEPTNHLDPITQELIGENFRDYKGTIILVSHNPQFVESIGINRILLLPSGKIVNYYPDIVEYYYSKNTTDD